MAPTYASANAAYDPLVNSLRAACIGLECHLPPSEGQEAENNVAIPSNRPKKPTPRECVPCQEELEQLDEEARAEHQCTHVVHDDSLNIGLDQQLVDPRRRRQPNAGVIRQDLSDVKERFDSFTKGLSSLVSLCDDRNESQSYQHHLTIWAEYIADIRARAFETLEILEAPQRARQHTIAPDNTVPVANNTPA